MPEPVRPTSGRRLAPAAGLAGAAVLLLLLGAAARSPGSGRDLTVQVEASRTSFKRGSGPRVDYTLRVASRTEQHLSLSVTVPSVVTRGQGRARDEGGTLLGPLLGVTADSADGSSARPVTTTVGAPGCSPRGLAPHGSDGSSTDFDLFVTAGGTVDIHVGYLVHDRPLWPGADYRLAVVARPEDGGAPIKARGPQLRGRGPHGTLVTLSTRPASAAWPQIARLLPRIRAGRTVEVHGRTSPPLRSRRVAVRAAHGRQRGFHLVRRVRTDRRGRFVLRDWRPRAHGVYELAVATPAVGRRVLADYACPVAFRLVGR